MNSLRNEYHNKQLALFAAIGVVLLLLTRVVYVVYARLSLDSDSAITGIAAMHISRGEAFPLFSYGQSYIIAVESWLAAPVFMLAGPSAAALKFPLLLLNVFCLLFMMREFRRGCGLDGAGALAACSFFAAPGALMACRLTDSMGGNIESFAWAMLLWASRRRPWVFGAVAALGTLNRTFVAFAAFWAAGIYLWDNRAGAAVWVARAGAPAVAIFAAAWYFVTFKSGGAGAGLAEMASGGVAPGAGLLFSDILPSAFGLRAVRLAEYGMLTGVTVGRGAVSMVVAISFAAMCGLFAAALATRGKAGGEKVKPESGGDAGFPLFLVLTGLSSVAFYLMFGARLPSIHFVRYVLFAALIPCGAAAAYLRIEGSRSRARVFMLCAAVVAAANVYSAGLLWREYATSPPPYRHGELADYLLREGITHVNTDYWTAYHLSFITGEKVMATSSGKVVVKKYSDEFLRRPGEFYQVKDSACTRGEVAYVSGWHICHPSDGVIPNQH